uniref:ABC transporter C family member 3 n=3 Tax=Anthurium amnicola TaxID=1678845 RepID=A0A1D1YVQ9_9ARAE
MGFLLGVLVLHVFSASCHLGLLLVLSIAWSCRSCRRARSPDSLEKSRFQLYKSALFTCLGLALFHLLVCIFYYSCYLDGWGSEDKLAVQINLAVRVVAWLAVSAYLHFEFPRSREKKFPLFLRVWWCIYLLICCASLVIDLIYYRKLGSEVKDLWVLDTGSGLLSLFLSYTGFFGKRIDEDEGPFLRKPLLNDGDVNGYKRSGHGSLPSLSNANFFSVLTFSWIGPLISEGYKKTLDLDDVPQLRNDDSVKVVFPIFKSKLESHTSAGGDGRIGTLQLVKVLVSCTWLQILWSGIFAFVYTLSTYVGPWLINTFVQYLNGRRRFASEGYLLVTAFVASKIFESLSQRHWFLRVQQAGVRFRAALVAMIYQKGLSLSSNSRQSHTSGVIINLMSIDADRIGQFSWYMHDIWMVTMQVVLALLLLYANVGLASIAALAATIVAMLMNIPLGRMQEKYQEKLMSSKDTRMKTTSEILRNMRILKLQAWEMKFLSRVIELRKNETNWLRKYVYTSAMTAFLFSNAPTFVSVVTFGACILLGIPLESGKILSALATIRVLQEPIYILPDMISMFIQTKVSLDRISSFLNVEEFQADAVEKLPMGSSEVAVEVSNGNFCWERSSEHPTLKDLNLRVLHGMRVAVCGTVGSGKSSLLSCILGEIPKISGTVRLSGTTAYVAQSPWIQSGKIEDNILFGNAMNRDKYEHVLEACALKKDLELLPFGDQTVIGETGINLSGGQKQRIQIARAMYHDADIFLFDDPFSAVDTHTGSHLFKECLLGFLASKTVIYVTHQVEFLPSADLILVMKNGRITQAGKYDDLLTSGTDFMELVGAHIYALSALDSCTTSSESPDKSMVEVENHLKPRHNEENKDEQNGNTGDISAQMGQLIQEEEREKGRVGFSVYWRYITTASKGVHVPFILLAQILFQALQIVSNYWIAWAAPMSKGTKPPVSSSVLIYVYVAFALGSSICVLLRSLLLVTAGYETATLLFNKMHACIFRAPVSFFDSTPSGRILNRASTDQSEVDTAIPNQIGSFVFTFIQLLGIIVVMSQVAWQVLIVFIPVIITCIWYQQYYIVTARELARLVGVCKAPLIQHFAESLSGSTTIRGFDQISRFMGTNFLLSDAFSRPKFYNLAAREWMCFRLDMLSVITFAFCLVFLVSVPVGTIDPVIAGLAVTYGLNLNADQSWVTWHLCNLENKMISVERILQYTCIPSEPPLTIETNKPDCKWPSQGEVDIRGIQVRYAPHLPFVLRGLTCTFAGGMKTGIVGRTGSGKSTLIQTLFRIVDPTVGRILIDGTDISSIGLHDLRSRLSIIPQDPTMFQGSVRSNLDPLEECTDEQIWQALDICQLGDEVRRKEGKLDSAVTENGENWSMGQRQLVCLGRVVLKRSKILVLDEATASVDTATDNVIQKTLRQQFSDSTVITIAHRLTSVLDSDMVLILDNGMIAEFNTPSKLLENKSSVFAKLVSAYTIRASSSFERLDMF